MVAIGPDGTPIDMGAIVQMLQELRIDNVTIAEITSALADGVDRVEGFELARRAVREAILTMVHDLQHYSEGVETFRKGFNVADQHAQEDLAHIAAQVGSVRSATDGGLDR